MTTIAVHPKAKGACLASVTYSDGHIQESGVKHVVKSRVVWAVRVPTNAAPGRARWTVTCSSWHTSGLWNVETPVAPTPSKPSVVVQKSGYSQRPSSFGSGSNISYGLFLQDTSSTLDALNVYVLVNFVAADGELVGTYTQTVPLITAASTYTLGNNFSLRTQTAVAKLEITLQVSGGQPTKAGPLPNFVNVRVLPGEADPSYVGEVDGEIVNDSSPETLTQAKLSIVVLDANGNILGGGNAYTFSPLPSGARMVFLAQSGFDAIPFAQAASVAIAVLPTYTPS